jgi:hypothetical protein
MNISKKIRLLQWFLIAVILTLLIACQDEGTGSSGGSGAPVITSVSSTIFTVGKAKSFTFTAIGTPAPKFSLGGTLPAGLTFVDSTGVLSGTAEVGTSGLYPLVITASNEISPNAADNFLLTVSNTILIVHDGTAGLEANIVTNLSNKIVAAGLVAGSVIAVPSVNLNQFAQIWDVRFNNTTPLTDEDIARYTYYLISGGSLTAIGENTGFVTRNISLSNLIVSLGGDTIKFKSPINVQSVLSPFDGPDSVSTITYLASAGTSNPGKGAFITKDTTNTGSGIVYWPGRLPNARAGRVLFVFDCNFLDPSADANSQKLINNMIALP